MSSPPALLLWPSPAFLHQGTSLFPCSCLRAFACTLPLPGSPSSRSPQSSVPCFLQASAQTSPPLKDLHRPLSSALVFFSASLPPILLTGYHFQRDSPCCLRAHGKGLRCQDTRLQTPQRPGTHWPHPSECRGEAREGSAGLISAVSERSSVPTYPLSAPPSDFPSLSVRSLLHPSRTIPVGSSSQGAVHIQRVSSRRRGP